MPGDDDVDDGYGLNGFYDPATVEITPIASTVHDEIAYWVDLSPRSADEEVAALIRNRMEALVEATIDVQANFAALHDEMERYAEAFINVDVDVGSSWENTVTPSGEDSPWNNTVSNEEHEPLTLEGIREALNIQPLMNRDMPAHQVSLSERFEEMRITQEARAEEAADQNERASFVQRLRERQRTNNWGVLGGPPRVSYVSGPGGNPCGEISLGPGTPCSLLPPPPLTIWDILFDVDDD